MNAGKIHCGPVEIDAANRRVVRSGVTIEIEPKVLGVILVLLSRPQEIVTREELLDLVWGHRYISASALNRVIVIARRAFDESAELRYIQTVHRAGYRYVGPSPKPVDMKAPRALFGPPSSARTPLPNGPIIGREQELLRLSGLLAEQRAVTLVGAGGMGKTQCALRFAQLNESGYADGIWFYDLSALQSADEWLQTLASTLSLATPPGGDPDLLSRVALALAGRQTLLLIDNCDRISSGVGAIIVQILRHATVIQVLATSQHPLHFVGEQLLAIPSLTLPPAMLQITSDQLGRVRRAPAVALLLDRIQRAGVSLELTPDNAATLIEICRRLDGMPLALELAATRFTMLSAAQVLERLDRRFGFLVNSVAGRDRRHQTLWALIEWSYQFLSEEERRLLRALSVFVAGWSVATILPMASEIGVSEQWLIDLLNGLVQKSLVGVDAGHQAPRFRLLESVRDFALQQLALNDEDFQARNAHFKCIRTMTEHVHQELLSVRMVEQTRQLNMEADNISAAIEWGSRQGCHERVLDITGELLIYLRQGGRRGADWIAMALLHTDSIKTPARGRTLLAKGILELHRTASGMAADVYLLQAKSLADEMGDRWAYGCACGFRALGFANDGRGDAARANVDSIVEVSNDIQDDWLRSVAALAQGWLSLSDERPPNAVAALQPARNATRDLGQNLFIDTYLALAHFRLEQLSVAATLWSGVMRAALEIQHTRSIASGIEGCAYLAASHGENTQSLKLLTVADLIRERMQLPLFSFWRIHHDAAMEQARRNLSPEIFSNVVVVATRMRPEDAANDAFESIERFASGNHGKQF